MKDKFLPFCVGIIFGWQPFNWLIHIGYIAAIIGSFFIGRYLGFHNLL